MKSAKNKSILVVVCGVEVDENSCTMVTIIKSP